MKIFRKKRKGAAQLFVIGALILVSVFSTYVIKKLQADIYQMHAYSLQMQAYYLAEEAASASVSALLADDDASLVQTGAFPIQDQMIHTSNGAQIGTSQIRVTKEVHNYYNENKDWIVVRVNTSVPDTRAQRRGQPFTYSMTVMILRENPLIQLYNIDPDEI